MVKRVLSESGVTAPPIDLKRILQAHSIAYVEVEDFPETVSALIVEDGQRTYAAVNSREHLHRQRFSLAHELGHYFLHRQAPAFEEPITIDNPPEEEWQEGSKDPAEAEADMFAGELLVPSEMLKKHYRKGVTIPDLSKLFLVSEQVISIAISRHYSTLFK